MVREYVAKYGGTASDVNADVAEAYSVGQVTAAGGQGDRRHHRLEDHRLPAQRRHAAPACRVRCSSTALGENVKAIAFVFQWQNGKFVQVLPRRRTGSVPVQYPKPNW